MNFKKSINMQGKYAENMYILVIFKDIHIIIHLIHSIFAMEDLQ